MLYFLTFFVASLIFLGALGIYLLVVEDREWVDTQLKEARDDYDKELTTLKKWSKGTPITAEEHKNLCGSLRKKLHKEIRECDFFVRLDLKPCIAPHPKPKWSSTSKVKKK